MEFIIRRAVQQALEKFVEGDFSLAVNLFSSGRTVLLENLRLKEDALPARLPVKILRGVLGRVVISLPLFALKSKPTEVYVEDVQVVLEVKEESDISRADLEKTAAIKKSELRKLLERVFLAQHVNGEDATEKGQGEEQVQHEGPSGMNLPKFPAFVRQLIRNVKVHVGNIHVRLEQAAKLAEEGFGDTSRCTAIGFVLQSIDIESCGPDFTPGMSPGTNSLFKLIRVSRLGLYVDSEAPRDKVAVEKLVSYEPHTWMLEPVTLNIRLGAKDCWPLPPAAYKPDIFVHITQTRVKAYLHPSFTQAFERFVKENEAWRRNIIDRLKKYDERNSGDTMSKAEHQDRCNAYEELYKLHLAEKLGTKEMSKGRKKKLSRKFQAAEAHVHMDDLIAIWKHVLREARQDVAAWAATVGMGSVASPSAASGPSELPGASHLIRMISSAQQQEPLEDHTDDEESEDVDTPLMIDISAAVHASNFQPHFHADIFFMGVEARVALSKFSDNSCQVSIGGIGFSVREHDREDMTYRVAPSLDRRTCVQPRVQIEHNAHALNIRVLEIRGLKSSLSAYVVIRYQGATNRTKTFLSSKNPIFNESLSFEDVEVDRPHFLLAQVEVWTVHDLRKDKLLCSGKLKIRNRDLKPQELLDTWLQMPKELVVRIAVEKVLNDVPCIIDNEDSVPKFVKSWPGGGHEDTLWVSAWIGEMKVTSIATVAVSSRRPDSAADADQQQSDEPPTTRRSFGKSFGSKNSFRAGSRNSNSFVRRKTSIGARMLKSASARSTKTEIRKIDIFSSDSGLYAVVIADLAKVRALEWPLDVYVEVRVPKLWLLISRWQTLFLLTQWHRTYLPADGSENLLELLRRQRAEERAFKELNKKESMNAKELALMKEVLKKEIDPTLYEGIDLGSSRRDDSFLGGSNASNNGRSFRPWVTVRSRDPLVKLQLALQLDEAKAGFTWADGSAVKVLDRNSIEMNSITYASVNSCIVLFYSHETASSSLLEVAVGAIGLSDSKSPTRPVLTRKDHRNTNFVKQGSAEFDPMLKVIIDLPFGWAYSLNFHNRTAVKIPENIGSKLNVHVLLQDVAIETPALQYALPALIGGVMPLTKLIEIPDIPSIAVESIIVRFQVAVVVYMAEKIDSSLGSLSFYSLLNLNSKYEVDAGSSAERFKVVASAQFGLCRLSRNETALQRSLRRRILPSQLMSHREIRMQEEDLGNSVWKLLHQIVRTVDAKFVMLYSPSANGIAAMEFRFTMTPIVMYFWVHDMALLFSIMLNFVNDIVVLEKQIEAILKFRLPDILCDDDLLSKSEDDDDTNHVEKRNTFVEQHFRRLSMGSHDFEDEDEDSSRGSHGPKQLSSFIGMQEIVQVPLSVPDVDKVKYAVHETAVTLLLVIGHDDSPVFRFGLEMNLLWNRGNLDLGLQLSAWFFNLKKAGWEPVIEPWAMNGVFATDKSELGIRHIELQGAKIAAKQVLEIDISDEFVTAVTKLAVQGMSYLDEESQHCVTKFYPIVDEDRKHAHAFELWNFTGETVFVQKADSNEGISVKDARSQDAHMTASCLWVPEVASVEVQDRDNVELDFWPDEGCNADAEQEGRMFMEDLLLPQLLGNSSSGNIDHGPSAGRKSRKTNRPKRFIKLRFQENAEGAYLVRVDRVGDYALVLANGNVLRVAIGTRDGLVRNVKLMSTVSIANRSGSDLWLTRQIGGNTLSEPLAVLRTLYCPLTMTDDNAELSYGIEALHKKEGEAEQEMSNTIASLSVNLGVIPTLKDTLLLESGLYLCAIEFEFLPLQAMSTFNYFDSNVNQSALNPFARLRSYRPHWIKRAARPFRSNDWLEKRASEILHRQRTLRAVQIILKPLYSILNNLPVPLLVSTIHKEGPVKDPNYVAPGGRFVCDDSNTVAMQFKLPSEDSEWSLPVPLKQIAPPQIAASVSAFESEDFGAGTIGAHVMELTGTQDIALADAVREKLETAAKVFAHHNPLSVVVLDKTPLRGRAQSELPSRELNQGLRKSIASAANIDDGPKNHRSKCDLEIAEEHLSPSHLRRHDTRQNVTAQGSQSAGKLLKLIESQELQSQSQIVSRTFEFPIARRVHPETLHRSPWARWLSVRLKVSQEKNVMSALAPMATLNTGLASTTRRRITLMFDKRILETRVRKIDPVSERFGIVWEETMNFNFRDLQSGIQEDEPENMTAPPRWLYVQYVGVFEQQNFLHHQTSAQLLGGGYVDLFQLLLNRPKSTDSGSIERRQKLKDIPIFAVLSGDAGQQQLDHSSVIAHVDLDARAIWKPPNTQIDVGTKRLSRGADSTESKFIRKDSQGVRDVEPGTDTEEFEILSKWGSEEEEDSDIESLREEDGEEVFGAMGRRRRGATTHWDFVRTKKNTGVFTAFHRDHDVEQNPEEHISYVDSRLLGKSPFDLRSFEQWGRVEHESDLRRPPLQLRCRIGSSSNTGFRIALHTPLWFVNDSSVDAVLQTRVSGSSYLQIVEPRRSVLLEDDSGSFKIALRRFGKRMSDVLTTTFRTPSMTFKFKDVRAGRPLQNTSRFIAAQQTNMLQTFSSRHIRFWHSVYVSNWTDLIIELRPTGAFRRLGTLVVEPDQLKEPWHFGCSEFQIRSRDFHHNLGTADDASPGEEEFEGATTFPTSDWCGVVDLESETFRGEFVSVPVMLLDTDGVPVRVFRIVVTTSKQAADTRFVTFTKDEPSTLLIANRTERIVLVSQKESTFAAGDEMSLGEMVLHPGESTDFGWTDPSVEKPQICVRMVLDRDDKQNFSESAFNRFLNIPDELVQNYRFSKVGKLKSVSIGAVEMHAHVAVVGKSRLLVIACEATASGGKALHLVFSSLGASDRTMLQNQNLSSRRGMGPLREGDEDVDEEDVDADDAMYKVGSPQSQHQSKGDGELSKMLHFQFGVMVRVIEARGIGAPRGDPSGGPRVIVECGPESSITPDGEAVELSNLRESSTSAGSTSRHLVKGEPVGSVRWVHAPFQYGFNGAKPKTLRLTLVQPLKTGLARGKISGDGEQLSERLEEIGNLEVNIGSLFDDTKGEIKKITPGWTKLQNSLQRNTELRFEAFLLSNRGAGIQEIPCIIRMNLKGIGLSIINGAKLHEDLYGRISDLDAAVRFESDGSISVTVRVESFQVDNNQPFVQNRVCIVPAIKNVRFLELFTKIELTGAGSVTVDTLQVITQAIDVKIDELFLDAILGVVSGFTKESEVLALLIDRAKLSVSGSFEGKRSTSYEFVEVPHTGETLVKNASSRSIEQISVHKFFAQHAVETFDILREVDRVIQSNFIVYVRDLHVYPMKVTLSFFFKVGEGDFLTQYQSPKLKPFKGLFAGFNKWSDVVIRLGDIHETDMINNPVKLVRSLVNRYLLMLTKQFWKGLAALDVIGNPQHLIERVFGSVRFVAIQPVRSFQDEGVKGAAKTLSNGFGSLTCTCIAAPLQSVGRITGSFATMLEGTRPIRHVGKPVRFLTQALEATQRVVEFFDPLHEFPDSLRRRRTFNREGLYEVFAVEDADRDSNEAESRPDHVVLEVLPPTPTLNLTEDELFEDAISDRDLDIFASRRQNTRVLKEYESAVTFASSQGVRDASEVVLEISDNDPMGLSDEAIEQNRKSQFRIAHNIHCCLLCVPGINIIWFPVYILHLLGILQWF